MRYRYPLKSLYGDYLRAAIGVGFIGTPLYLSGGSPIIGTILGAIVLLFVGFGLRTAVRHMTVIEVSSDGIATTGPFSRQIAWDDIRKVELKFFSTRREKKSGGWMQLKICGPNGCLRIESTLPGFDDITARAAAAAFRNGAEMNETTLENLDAMGVTITLPEGAPG